MAKAIAVFSVTGPEGRPVTYEPGDEVPDEIAAMVGEHVLDVKPPVDLNRLEDMDFENADEALKAAIELAGQKVDELEEENERLQAEVKELTEFKEKILSGDLTDLDLDVLQAEVKENDGDQSGSGDPADPDATTPPPADLYDPNEHNYDDVLKHLEGVDPEEFARIIEVEKAGKNRKSVVGDGE